MADGDEQIPYTTSLVVDAGVQRDLSRALYLSMFRGPFIWILIAALFLIFAGTALRTTRAPGFLEPTILWLVVIGLVAVLRWFTVRRAVHRTYPIGRQLRTGFGATHFAITDGENSSTVAYSGLDRIEVGRGVIWMRRRQLRRRLAYPGGLFPGPEVDRMRAAAGLPS